jgi:TolB protein
LSFSPTPLFLSQFLPFFDQYALSHRLWSPDSNALVLPIMVDGRAQIIVVDAERGEARRLANGISAFWSQQ